MFVRVSVGAVAGMVRTGMNHAGDDSVLDVKTGTDGERPIGVTLPPGR